MPKYVFECAGCTLCFERSFKMGDHVDHPCPSCGNPAPRVIEGFAFQFTGTGGAPGNTGVHDLDYPTADKIVGRDADLRKEVLSARDEAKNGLRKQAGINGLQRINGEDGSIEYHAMNKPTIEARRKLADQAIQAARARKNA
jgi:putative FmdB family regulatory protein